MAIVKKNDFVEIDYTARLKEGSKVFDTTKENVARENGLSSENPDYSPIIICVGENSILKAVEEQIIGKETGKDYTFEISQGSAFGKKDARLIQMIPINKFRQQNIQPVPGLQLNVDGVFGVVKTVSGGRCMVDFNHPLAGKDLVYEVTIKRVVEDGKEKLKSLLKVHLGIPDAEVEMNEGNAAVKPKRKLAKQVQEEFNKIACRLIPGIKNVTFAAAEDKAQ